MALNESGREGIGASTLATPILLNVGGNEANEANGDNAYYDSYLKRLEGEVERERVCVVWGIGYGVEQNVEERLLSLPTARLIR